MSTPGVPFLILEMAKTEYRRLKTLKHHPDPAVRRLANDLRIYTPGDERVSPFRVNPLAPINGFPLDTHGEHVLHCFNGSMPITGPMPELLREGQEQANEDHPDSNDPPLIADLVAAVEKVLSEKGYSHETSSDIRAALHVRLGALTHGSVGKVFQCRRNIPDIEDLMTTPSVIELDHLPPEQACLLALFILMLLGEYIKTTASPGGRLRFVIIIDEAHLLVGRSTDASPSETNADPKAYAAAYVVRMLAVLRALGVGIVIVDQHPSSVASEVIKSTRSKLAFPQVDMNDREQLGSAMLFGAIETEEIARLNPGEAYFLSEGYHGPRRIRTVDLFTHLGMGDPPLNEALIPFICDEDWFIQAASARQDAELDQLRWEMNTFDSQRMSLLKRTAALLVRYPHILAMKDHSPRSASMNRLTQEARLVQGGLESAFRIMQRRYRALLGPEVHSRGDGPSINVLRANLVQRFESVITADTQSCIQKLAELIGRCQSKASYSQGA